MRCANTDCPNICAEGYKYCMDCYNKWKENNPTAKTTPPIPKKWHDDAIVDQLMKMNSNLYNIGILLEGLVKSVQNLPTPPGTYKGMNRAKPGIDSDEGMVELADEQD